jgi:hypothetical protein
VRSAVAEIVQLRGGRLAAGRRREHVEVLVIALDEVEWRVRREILAVIAGDVADGDLQHDVGVPPHDELNGLELAVDVA